MNATITEPRLDGEQFTIYDADKLTDEERHLQTGLQRRGRQLGVVGLLDGGTPITVTYVLSHVTIAFGLYREDDDLHFPSGHSYHSVYAHDELYEYTNSPHPAVHDGETEPEYLVIDGEAFNANDHAGELWMRGEGGGHNEDYIYCDGYDDGQPSQNQYEAFWLAVRAETPEEVVYDRFEDA